MNITRPPASVNRKYRSKSSLACRVTLILIGSTLGIMNSHGDEVGGVEKRMIELVAALQDDEARLAVVQNEAEVQNFRWDRGASEWKAAGGARAISTFVGSPGSKAKVQYESLVMPWTGGAADLAEEASTAAFDGKVGQYLKNAAGSRGATREVLSGFIEAERPSLLNHDVTGWAISLYGNGDSSGLRLSERLPLIFELPNVELQIEDTEYRGEEAVSVRFVREREQFEYMLSKERNHAVLRTRDYTEGTLVAEVVVLEFSNPTEGVYYPKVATKSLFERDGTPRWRLEYSSTSTSVNTPELIDFDYSINWPEGAFIDNRIAGVQ